MKNNEGDRWANRVARATDRKQEDGPGMLGIAPVLGTHAIDS